MLFGVQAAMNMPYRLIPNIEYPQITIRTTWTGASPYDMEKEVIDRQERVLKSIPGLTEFESTAMEGRCNVKLTFDLSVLLMLMMQYFLYQTNLMKLKDTLMILISQLSVQQTAIHLRLLN